MKLSLAWIFDHLVGSWNDYDIHEIVKQCSLKVAEIDHYQKITIDLTAFTLVRVHEVAENNISAFSAEWDKEFILSHRSDAQVGQHYIVKKVDNTVEWALLTDWASAKDGLIPALYVDDLAIMGSWKDAFEAEDYILDIDNVTITNRPDLWCHRGFARELGALFDIPLKPYKLLLSEAMVKPHKQFAAATPNNPFSLEIKDARVCNRFAGIYFSSIVCRPSPLLLAQRLARVDARPINSFVDITNYVTFDMSQPLHAFDAQKLQGNKLVQRLANKDEKLTLLDGQTIELSSDDMVVADGKGPVGLAGIMGGATTGVSPQTSSVLLESANYHASVVRKTSTRFKIRTEASARFEKSLDPNQNVTGILRFLKLLEDEKIPFESNFEIQSLGKEVDSTTIIISHEYIESALGVEFKPDYIVKTLSLLEFGVEQKKQDGKLKYIVTVPTFRGTKDITIQEDIIEEIGRFFGYTNIPAVLPAMPLGVADLSLVTKTRAVKQQLAFGTNAREVNNYPCYDEQFLATLTWEPRDFVEIKNPVSEQSRRLVTSLVPHLFKSITQNPKETALRFFEMNKIWRHHKKVVDETMTLSGIFYDKHADVSFYDGKRALEVLFSLVKCDVQWKKAEKDLPAWCHPYQTAVIESQGNIIGYAGNVDPGFFAHVAEGDTFIFELNADLLLASKVEDTIFKPLPKYPETSFDVSMVVPLSVTVQRIKDYITAADKKIISVVLLDIFQKDEWHDQKSVTVRFVARDQEKTLEKNDIDALYQKVVNSLGTIGAQIR